MNPVRNQAQQAAEDIFFGQTVMIWARWFVILGTAIITLWSATTPGELTTQTLVLVALMATNFVLHGRYLLERPANRHLLLGVSAFDLLVVSLIIATWQAEGGLRGDLFVFLYPLLAAFAFVFQPRVTAMYTVLVLATYLGACVLAQPSVVLNGADLKILVMRLITLAAVGGLSTFYWRMVRRRRYEAEDGTSQLVSLEQRLRMALPGE